MHGILLMSLMVVSLLAGGCGALSSGDAGSSASCGRSWFGSDENVANSGAFQKSTLASTAAMTIQDTDQDGVADAMDDCPDTTAGLAVDSRGCIVECNVSLTVTFAGKSDALAPAQDDRLRRLAQLMRDNPMLLGTITAHAASTSTDGQGDALLHRRLERVRAGLIDQHGVAPHRLQIAVLAEEASLRPLAPATGTSPDCIEVRLRGAYSGQGGWLALGKPYNIMFLNQETTIDAAMQQRLDVIGRQLQAHPDEQATLEGHSDNVGNRQSNLALSRSRAEAVREYLAQRWQIAPERLAMAAMADAAPLASNDSERGRELNRRVSIRLHRGMSSGVLQAKARAVEQQLQDPADTWRDHSVPRVVVHAHAPLEFGQGETALTPEMVRRLESIGAMLAARPELRVIVQGHCDNAGNPQLEQQLAWGRAEAVRLLLMQRYHIAPERLDVRSYGAELPVATNTTEEGRKRNRRVELRIVTGK